MIAVWGRTYNSIRPHPSLGYQPAAPKVLRWPAINCQPASQYTKRLAFKEIRKLTQQPDHQLESGHTCSAIALPVNAGTSEKAIPAPRLANGD
jgi:hypothetical protein